MISLNSVHEQLDHFDPDVRLDALKALTGGRKRPDVGTAFNLHCHSYFSFNGYGFSPTGLAVRGWEQGLYAMGLVDFDVLDGVDEFLDVCETLQMRACASMETRVFVPEFADDEINSPGEPGIAYHMGCGFTQGHCADDALVHELLAMSNKRTLGLIDRVNAFLNPVVVDFDADLLPLTPGGNATERHVCVAYMQKAEEHFPDTAARVAYWADKLGTDLEKIEAILNDGPALQGLIRSKTMKSGGVGYVQPSGPDFPKLDAVNAFTRSQGAIPTHAWLDGTTSGEARQDELMDSMIASGTEAVNLIPDRSWNITDKDTQALKVANMHSFVAAAQERHLPVLVGTEMNAYGLPFVDNFTAEPMKPLYTVFKEGADILHAHTQLELHGGKGYVSNWASDTFSEARDKYAFYAAAGALLSPGNPLHIAMIQEVHEPGTLLEHLKSKASF